MDIDQGTRLFPETRFLEAYSGRILISSMADESRGAVPPKVHAESIKGALQLGRLDVLRTVCKSPGTIKTTYSPRSIDCITKSLDGYLYMHGISLNDLSLSTLGELMISCANNGSVEMMRQLSKHEDLIGLSKKRISSEALLGAAKNYQVEAVNYLIDHWRASSNAYGALRKESALRSAAGAGSLTIVRKVLDHGHCLREEEGHRHDCLGRVQSKYRRMPPECICHLYKDIEGK